MLHSWVYFVVVVVCFKYTVCTGSVALSLAWHYHKLASNESIHATSVFKSSLWSASCALHASISAFTGAMACCISVFREETSGWITPFTTLLISSSMFPWVLASSESLACTLLPFRGIIWTNMTHGCLKFLCFAVVSTWDKLRTELKTSSVYHTFLGLCVKYVYPQYSLYKDAQ